jgi:hypothetical protein
MEMVWHQAIANNPKRMDTKAGFDQTQKKQIVAVGMKEYVPF